eukprot:Hpha_TRINITY_DN15638_c3_g1::TRINITY_DN15638_c3_g1_i2::g.98301::m.98301
MPSSRTSYCSNYTTCLRSPIPSNSRSVKRASSTSRSSNASSRSSENATRSSTLSAGIVLAFIGMVKADVDEWVQVKDTVDRLREGLPHLRCLAVRSTHVAKRRDIPYLNVLADYQQVTLPRSPFLMRRRGRGGQRVCGVESLRFAELPQEIVRASKYPDVSLPRYPADCGKFIERLCDRLALWEVEHIRRKDKAKAKIHGRKSAQGSLDANSDEEEEEEEIDYRAMAEAWGAEMPTWAV